MPRQRKRCTQRKLYDLSFVLRSVQAKRKYPCDFWMKNNPGKTMTIYDFPGIVKEAVVSAVTPKNIISGFKCTGVFPFNRSIFEESDFSPFFVTDRPEIPENENTISAEPLDLEALVPYPKAPARNSQTRGRKKRKTCILTDTPIRNAILEEILVSKAKKAATSTKVVKNSKKSTEQASPDLQDVKVSTPKRVTKKTRVKRNIALDFNDL